MQANPKTRGGGETELTEGFAVDGDFFGGFEVLEMLTVVKIGFLQHKIVTRFYKSIKI